MSLGSERVILRSRHREEEESAGEEGSEGGKEREPLTATLSLLS